MKRKINFLVFIFAFEIAAYSETPKQVNYNNQAWFGDFSKVKLNKLWGIYLDFGLRRTDWLNKWSQILIRPGLTYSFNEHVSITCGVSYFSHYSSTYIRPEYRGWEQFVWSENYGRIIVNHRIRVEQRFNQHIENNKLTNDFNYNNRFRYQLNVQIPLNKQTIDNRTFYLTFGDEIMINNGKEIVYNYFDQNRASIGLGYKLNNYLNASVSYMNVFIQKNQPSVYDQNNVIVLNLYHSFSLIKKKNVVGA